MTINDTNTRLALFMDKTSIMLILPCFIIEKRLIANTLIGILGAAYRICAPRGNYSTLVVTSEEKREMTGDPATTAVVHLRNTGITSPA
jgi:hypothetical protein